MKYFTAKIKKIKYIIESSTSLSEPRLCFASTEGGAGHNISQNKLNINSIL